MDPITPLGPRLFLYSYKDLLEEAKRVMAIQAHHATKLGRMQVFRPNEICVSHGPTGYRNMNISAEDLGVRFRVLGAEYPGRSGKLQ